MSSIIEVIDRSGLVCLGESGSVDDVREGAFDRPWFHVRADGRVSVRDLGMAPGEPDFIVSGLDRSVSIAVSTEESEFWILVASDETPVPRRSGTVVA